MLIKRYELIEYKCNICDLTEIWNGKKISLQLDHINGIYNDNRLHNLRYLCPNCHSQTENFAGKKLKNKKTFNCSSCNKKIKGYSELCSECVSIKRRKIKRPSKEILEKEIQEYTMVYLGKKYGVSDNAIRKWCKRYNIF
jgi:predicted amidophosphoribosyltransferase